MFKVQPSELKGLCEDRSVSKSRQNLIGRMYKHIAHMQGSGPKKKGCLKQAVPCGMMPATEQVEKCDR